MSQGSEQVPGSPAPPGSRMSSGTRSTLLGAVFLMATSAIGPGFITQTTTFTVQLGAAFAFAIVVSIVIDGSSSTDRHRHRPPAERVAGDGVRGRRAQVLGNLLVPGLGRGLVVGWLAWLLTVYPAVDSVRPLIELLG